MYRRTKKYTLIRTRKPRAELAAEDQRPAAWRPPELRRRITIEDFDGSASTTHVIELHRTTRIDSYLAIVDGRAWKSRIGWSRVLDGLRKALPRLASPRHPASMGEQ